MVKVRSLFSSQQTKTQLKQHEKPEQPWPDHAPGPSGPCCLWLILIILSAELCVCDETSAAGAKLSAQTDIESFLLPKFFPKSLFSSFFIRHQNFAFKASFWVCSNHCSHLHWLILSIICPRANWCPAVQLDDPGLSRRQIWLAAIQRHALSCILVALRLSLRRVKK